MKLVAIGASAGGRKAVTKIFKEMPQDVDAAFVLVIHSAFDTPSFLSKALQKITSLNVIDAEDDMSLERGCIYIAKPDHHLFVRSNKIQLSKGPRENRFRPAIDVLFRSSAVSYSNECIGVLMSGRLSDGTAGLDAIKMCGGIAIVQDPKTAEFGDMPSYAVETVDVDVIADLNDLTEVIAKAIKTPAPEPQHIPQRLIRENEIAISSSSQIALENDLGKQVPLSCASCGGPLWEISNSKTKRYRCHVGHAFSQEALLFSQDESLEETLWVSLRTFEEKKTLLNRMASDYEERGPKMLAKSYRDKVEEVSRHITKLRSILELQD
ncbi:MAG: chemotaxis protein CheB [Leeuwenhoekiella sp.]